MNRPHAALVANEPAGFVLLNDEASISDAHHRRCKPHGLPVSYRSHYVSWFLHRRERLLKCVVLVQPRYYIRLASDPGDAEGVWAPNANTRGRDLSATSDQ